VAAGDFDLLADERVNDPSASVIRLCSSTTECSISDAETSQS